ncbi:MAG: SMP-30/gluconolactonase/LRE family protein [Pseudomonadota bacterium]
MPMVFVVAAGTLALAVSTVWVGHTFHQFEDINPVGDLTCQPVHGVVGAYDIEPVPGRNIAYLSVYDERGDALRGQILRFDFDNPLDNASWQDRTGGRPVLLTPAGISYHRHRLPSGELEERLFVVNRDTQEVMIFDIDAAGDLNLADRLSHPMMTSPNDIVATGPSSFYVSNDTAEGRGSLRGRAEFLFGLNTGSVLFFNGSSWSRVMGGLKFPNGMALGPDGDELHVAEMRAEAIRTLSRDAATGALEPSRRVQLRSFPNNLSVDREGRLLVGAVPQPFAYKAFTESLRDRAPSQVLRINGMDTEVLFQDAGKTLSAASAAAQVGDLTIIGSAADEKFLICAEARDGA